MTELNEQSPPLLMAAFRGDAEDIQLLLSGGANIETKGDDGATALSFAAAGGHVAAVETLLKHGARIRHRRPSDGCTALHLCYVLSPH